MSNSPESAATVCQLPESDQRRNLLLFAACTGLQYLSAPVLYVGLTQAALCDHLGAGPKVANLPGTMYFAMTTVPALIAWAFPYSWQLKRNMTACYSITGVMLAVLALTLALDVPNGLKIALVILQGAVSGAVMPAAIAFLWEAVARGSAEEKRGFALSLAFGFGPLLAVVGSLGQQSLLGGSVFGARLESPWNFVVLFALGAPALFVAAALTRFFVLPATSNAPPRAPLRTVWSLCLGVALTFVGMGCYQAATVWEIESLNLTAELCLVAAGLAIVWYARDILRRRILLIATAVTILAYAGNTIPSNMSLYVQDILQLPPEDYAGLQNTLRFSFKVVAGLSLGWLLTRTNPRMGLLVTSGIYALGPIWAIFARGKAYLIASGIHGAGELVGVYAPNYILSASRPGEIRRNMALATLLMAPAAPTGYMFGAIAQYDWTRWGFPGARAFGFQVSFAVCAALIVCGMVLALCALPPRPTRESEHETGTSV